MTLYEMLCDMSKSHTRFKSGGYADILRFDFYKRKISNGKVVIMNDGKVIPQTVVLDDGREYVLTEDMKLIDEVENPYEELENLYKEFYTSVPNPSSMFLVNNFQCKADKDLSFHEFVNGNGRNYAHTRLEAFVMLHPFEWMNEKHHYWQSSKYKSLILNKKGLLIKGE